MSGASFDRDSSSFKTIFIYHILWLFFKYKTLSQLNWLEIVSCQSLQSKKVSEKDVFHYINHYNSDTYLNFKLQWLAISKPFKLARNYISQKKVLICGKGMKSWKYKKLYHERVHWVLGKVMIFQFRELNHPQGYAMLNFFLQCLGKDSLCSKLALFKTTWQILSVLTHLSPLGSYFPYFWLF